MRRSRTALAAALILAASLAPQMAAAAELPPGGTFIDDNLTAQEPFIEAIAAAGITRGCNPPANDRYCPAGRVTRGQMAAFLARALDLAATEHDRFGDDSLFEDDINRLAAAGITRGCNPPANDRFCPDAAVTRAQMAAFLHRALDGTIAAVGDVAAFTDTDGSLFAADIAWLQATGISHGCNPPANDHFCPKRLITRGEMAVFLSRGLALAPIVPPPPPAVSLDALPRSAWGADPPDPSKMDTHVIDTLTVHHAGEQWGRTGPARYRVWQDLHTGRGWGDVAYHYIIGIDGTVYEARDTAYAGDTNTNYDPAGHFLVVVEGNFDKEQPTQAQLDSLVRVLAWASLQFGVSPSTIGGHRDHAATSCPGGNLYPYIATGDLQRVVEELIAEGP
jgi:hypothetical protein